MIRLGIVGRNFVVDWMLAAAEQVPELRPVAVCSRAEATGREFAARYRLPLVFTSLEEMAESPEVDAVYLASPISCHYEQALLFLRHHKHVLCEKPVTTNAREARALVKAARAEGVVFLEAMMRQPMPPSVRVISPRLPSLSTNQYTRFSAHKSSRSTGAKKRVIPELGQRNCFPFRDPHV